MIFVCYYYFIFSKLFFGILFISGGPISKFSVSSNGGGEIVILIPKPTDIFHG